MNKFSIIVVVLLSIIAGFPIYEKVKIYQAEKAYAERMEIRKGNVDGNISHILTDKNRYEKMGKRRDRL